MLDEFLPGHDVNARDKNRLFNLVWDLTCSGHGLRTALFEALNATPTPAMLDQSQKQPLVYCVSLHAFIVGQPYRLRHLRRALSHICTHRDKLWIATGGEIARYFAESAPAKPE